MNMDIRDVSVVVCTRNNKENIRRVVQGIKNEKPGEIIVVDGNSIDGTREILDTIEGIKVLTDPGEGLALARQTALNEVRGKYTLFVGDDNILRRGSIYKLKEYMLSHDWVGAAFQTRVMNVDSYLSFCANWRWKVKFSEGVRDVLGTPYMYYTELLKKVGYDKECSVSDDSDIEKRISELTDKKYGHSNIICYEIGKTGFYETFSRFIMYGKSDFEFWKKYSKEWTFKRKIKSIRHPLSEELIKPISMIKNKKTKVIVLPYFLFITIVRYIGWIRSICKDRRG